jgi:MFS family permease
VATPTPADLEGTGGRPLTAVLIATFFVRFAFGITIAVFASYILLRSNGLGQADVGEVGLVSAMASIGEFSTVLLSGVVADRYGRFPVLFAGMTAAAVLLTAIATTRSPIALSGLNLLFGVTSGAILAPSLAVIAAQSRPDKVGYEMGRFDAMNLWGWIAGFAFGFGALGVLPNRSLPIVFLLGALSLVIGLSLASALVRGQPIHRGRKGVRLGDVLRPAFRLSVLLVTMPWLVIYMLIGTALVFLATSATGLGISPVYLALAIGVGGTLLVVTQPTFGRLADRVGRMRMMTVGATGFAALMVFASLLVAFGAKPILLIGTGVSVAAALSYGPAALAALADLSGEVGRATTMAIYSLTISLGMFLGLLASTGLYDLLGKTGLYLFFGTIAAALILLTVARHRVMNGVAIARVTTPAR